MVKTIKFTKSDGKISAWETVIVFLANAVKLLSNGEYVITIKKQVSQRSINQNALMWMWFACIENETGTDKQDVHDYYCKLFLRREVSVNGKREIVVSGTKNLLTNQMANFLAKIQADAASEFGITLPTPSDLAFEEFQNYYKRFI